MIEILLAPSYVIGQGYDLSTLTECLLFASGGKVGPYFGHVKPISGMDCSIRLLGKEVFAGSNPLPCQLNQRAMALELLLYSEASQEEDRARYKIRPSSSAVKGWTVSRASEFIDRSGNPLIAAYATWIEP
jgi:hypothetical protein